MLRYEAVCIHVAAAMELGSLSNREDAAQQQAEQHVEHHAHQQTHHLAQPSREPFPAQHSSQPHQGAGQVRPDHMSTEEAGHVEPANRSATVSTIVAVQSASAHHPGHQHAQHMRQLPVSPNATTRPFHAFLGSADKQRHAVYRAAAVNSGLVYVPEVGLVQVVPLGELAVLPRGAASGVQSFAGRLESLGIPAGQVAAVSVALDNASANAIQAAAPRALGQPEASQPGLPQLRVLRTMQQFWKLWADGDEFNGKGPLRDLPPELVDKKKQRYSEWRRAAEVVANRVAKMPSSSAGPSPTALAMVLEQLERERKAKGESMPTFIKALGKELKSAAGSD